MKVYIVYADKEIYGGWETNIVCICKEETVAFKWLAYYTEINHGTLKDFTTINFYVQEYSLTEEGPPNQNNKRSR